jgi:hypothetical protein
MYHLFTVYPSLSESSGSNRTTDVFGSNGSSSTSGIDRDRGCLVIRDCRKLAVRCGVAVSSANAGTSSSNRSSSSSELDEFLINLVKRARPCFRCFRFYTDAHRYRFLASPLRRRAIRSIYFAIALVSDGLLLSSLILLVFP